MVKGNKVAVRKKKEKKRSIEEMIPESRQRSQKLPDKCLETFPLKEFK